MGVPAKLPACRSRYSSIDGRYRRKEATAAELRVLGRERAVAEFFCSLLGPGSTPAGQALSEYRPLRIHRFSSGCTGARPIPRVAARGRPGVSSARIRSQLPGGPPMKNGMLIIDADGHAVDNEAVYRERLPEQYRKRNFIVSSDGFDRSQNGTIAKQPKDAVQNLADNDREGIDLQIIYPTGGLFLSRAR